MPEGLAAYGGIMRQLVLWQSISDINTHSHKQKSFFVNLFHTD